MLRAREVKMTDEVKSSAAESQEISARIAKLEGELSAVQHEYDQRGTNNSRMHQTLIIVSLLASVAATSMAPTVEPRWIVSVIAAIPGLGVALSQQLHCVESANLHYRHAQAARSLLTRLRYELPRENLEDEVAKIAKEFRSNEEELTAKWERVTLASLHPRNRKTRTGT